MLYSRPPDPPLELLLLPEFPLDSLSELPPVSLPDELSDDSLDDVPDPAVNDYLDSFTQSL